MSLVHPLVARDLNRSTGPSDRRLDRVFTAKRKKRAAAGIVSAPSVTEAPRRGLRTVVEIPAVGKDIAAEVALLAGAPAAAEVAAEVIVPVVEVAPVVEAAPVVVEAPVAEIVAEVVPEPVVETTPVASVEVVIETPAKPAAPTAWQVLMGMPALLVAQPKAEAKAESKPAERQAHPKPAHAAIPDAFQVTCRRYNPPRIIDSRKASIPPIAAMCGWFGGYPNQQELEEVVADAAWVLAHPNDWRDYTGTIREIERRKSLRQLERATGSKLVATVGPTPTEQPKATPSWMPQPPKPKAVAKPAPIKRGDKAVDLGAVGGWAALGRLKLK